MNLTQENKNRIRVIMTEAQRMISDEVGAPVSLMYRIKGNQISQNHILHMVMGHFRVTYQQMTSSSREEQFKVPRQVYCYLVDAYCGVTHSRIGKDINRDRSTVTTSIQVVRDMLDVQDPLYYGPVQKLEADLQELLKDPA